MTPLDIRPLPLTEPFASPGLAVADYCGFVDESVIRAIIGNDAAEMKTRVQPSFVAPGAQSFAGPASYTGERHMAFAR